MTGPWNDYLESNGKQKSYKCSKCREFGGRMKRREITEENSGEHHREYQIVCKNCGHKSSVHWTKTLTEKTWEAEGTAI